MGGDLPRSVLLSRHAIQAIKAAGKRRGRRMNQLISRTSNKIGVFNRNWRLRTVEGSIIRTLTLVVWLPACLTLTGCDFRKPTPAVTSTTVQSPTPSVTRVGPQGESPIPCKGGSAAAPLGPCSDGIQIIQVCGNCEADSGYPTSANRYGWWCTDSFEEAVKMLGFTQNCKVTRVVSQKECCDRSW